jgi:hypothetical protein
MMSETSPLKPKASGSSVGRSLSTLGRLKPVELATVKMKRRHQEHPFVIRSVVSTNVPICQHPGVYAMSLEDVIELLACLLQSEIITKLLGFIALFEIHRGDLFKLFVEPLLANFKRGEHHIPPTLSLCPCLDVFYYKPTNREEFRQPTTYPELPLPASLGRWGKTSTSTVFPILSARSLPESPTSTHLPPGLHSIFDPSYCVSLNVQIGVRLGFYGEALFLRSGVNSDSNRLHITS